VDIEKSSLGACDVTLSNALLESLLPVLERFHHCAGHVFGRIGSSGESTATPKYHFLIVIFNQMQF
jgi:hypothetical protein